MLAEACLHCVSVYEAWAYLATRNTHCTPAGRDRLPREKKVNEWIFSKDRPKGGKISMSQNVTRVTSCMADTRGRKGEGEGMQCCAAGDGHCHLWRHPPMIATFCATTTTTTTAAATTTIKTKTAFLTKARHNKDQGQTEHLQSL